MLEWSDLDYVTSASIHIVSELPDDATRPDGVIVFRVPPTDPTRAALIDGLASACRFRGAAGETWDSLYDGLTSMPRARGYVVVVEAADWLFRDQLLVGGRLLTVWLDAVDAFRSVATPLHLVLLVSRS